MNSAEFDSIIKKLNDLRTLNYEIKNFNFQTPEKCIQEECEEEKIESNERELNDLLNEIKVINKKVGIVKPYMQLDSKMKSIDVVDNDNDTILKQTLNANSLIGSLIEMKDFQQSAANQQHDSEKTTTNSSASIHTLKSDDNDDQVIDGDNDLFIERMQTISIRKNISKSSNNGVNYRRKSVHQINTPIENNVKNTKRESNFWNYDELNELKMKFLSLLTSSQSQSDNLNGFNSDVS